MSTNKIFENINAKRLFVSLYEELEESRRATFGQNIRDMFDTKITDMERIEGFYVNEADVRVCYEAAMKTPAYVKSDDAVENLMDSLTPVVTRFKKDEEEDFSKPATEENIPKNW